MEKESYEDEKHVPQKQENISSIKIIMNNGSILLQVFMDIKVPITYIVIFP